MVFDSHSMNSPSTSTGTIALGLSARKSGSLVALKPLPQSSRSYGRLSSSQVHRTLRTLIEAAFPRIFSMQGSV